MCMHMCMHMDMHMCMHMCMWHVHVHVRVPVCGARETSRALLAPVLGCDQIVGRDARGRAGLGRLFHHTAVRR